MVDVLIRIGQCYVLPSYDKVLTYSMPAVVIDMVVMDGEVVAVVVGVEAIAHIVVHLFQQDAPKSSSR